MSAPLVDVPHGVHETRVPCPTCGAFKGFACGQMHGDGAHRTRILAALRAEGRIIVRSINTKGTPYFWLVADRHYYDLVPGYRAVYVRREHEGRPLNALTAESPRA